MSDEKFPHGPQGKPAQGSEREKPHRPALRWPVAVGAVAASVSAVVALLTFVVNREHGAPSVGPNGTAGPTGVASSASGSAGPSNVPDAPVRRQGTLVMLPNQVADLDTTAGDWSVTSHPSVPADDLWFDGRRIEFEGARHGRIGVMASGATVDHDVCAHWTIYGQVLTRSEMTVGRQMCVLTGEQHVAVLKLTAVHDDVSGLPDELTFHVTVYAPIHTT